MDMKQLILIIPLLLSCSTIDMLKTVTRVSDASSNDIKTEIMAGDKTQELNIGDKAIQIHDFDADNTTINNIQKKIKQQNSIQANAQQVIQNNSISPYWWILLGLLIDFNALILNIKLIFTRIK
ncbi:hypothetical protein FWP57_00920 [Vibrio cholerae]|nr:hypothetical protein [Vibrio cholerae]